MDPYQGGGLFPGVTTTYPTLAQQYGGSVSNADALLADVISFDVKIDDPASQSFIDIPYNATGSPNLVFNNFQPPNPPGVCVFDTWSNKPDQTQAQAAAGGPIDAYDYSSAWSDTNPASPAATQLKRIPLQRNVRAIQITIRLWDKKTQRSRQMTFVQNM
jgi:hypothetical protein